jgi:hypothetical protein
MGYKSNKPFGREEKVDCETGFVRCWPNSKDQRFVSYHIFRQSLGMGLQIEMDEIHFG